ASVDRMFNDGESAETVIEVDGVVSCC
ncbi:hypothetical protein Tco_0634355, partial [Tanacetum coccineum]